MSKLPLTSGASRARAGGPLATGKPAGGQTEGQPTRPTEATFGTPSSWGLWSVVVLLVLALFHQSFDSHVSGPRVF